MILVALVTWHTCVHRKEEKVLSMQADDFITYLFYHFKRSVKRKATLREYLEFTNTEVKKIIKHVTTKWLSLGKSVDRTLMQWEALRSYFISEFEEDDALDEDKVTREVRLIRQFNDPFTKLCVLFVQLVMPVFDQFNTFLQSEEPLVDLLHESTIKLYKGLLSNFIKTEILSKSNDVLLIDIENSESFKELNTIHTGFITKQYADAEDITGTPRHIKLLREVQLFFITSSKYLLKSMPTLRDPLLKCLSIFLRTSERSKIEEEHVSLLIKRFPQVVQTEDLHKLHAKLLDYHNQKASELLSEIDSDKVRKRIDIF